MFVGLLLHGDEHPTSGWTSGHGNDHGNGSGWVAAQGNIHYVYWFDWLIYSLITQIQNITYT